MVSLFFSYSHADEQLRDELEKQLSMLKRQGIIEAWHDRRIGAGNEFAKHIDDHAKTDDIILLLVSPDFLASDYCYEIELQIAMQRHERGEALVIPVILRPCDWHAAPFGKLNAIPRDGKAITRWPDRDEAMLEVVKSIRAAASKLLPSHSAATPAVPKSQPTGYASTTKSEVPRSSNLRIAKSFSERDKDKFLLDAFEYMTLYFENSLQELEARNSGIESNFRRVDANRFFASVYRAGQAVARCTIFVGSSFGSGICFSQGGQTSSNSMNEVLQVEADDQSLFLRSMMSFHEQNDRHRKLTKDGAAELYWSRLVEPLQRN